MSARVKRGPQALSTDRRQARPMALRGASAPAGAVVSSGRRQPGASAARRARPERPEDRPDRHALGKGEDEPEVERALRLLAAHLSTASEGDALGRSVVRAATLRDPDRLLRRLRSQLGLERDEDAEALVAIERAWLRYSSPEDTADVAACLPADLHGLRERAALLELPRWRRLRLPPPAHP